MKNMTVKKWFALLLKIGLAIVCMAFLGTESLNFFSYVFPADQWYMAYTGFGLTMGAMLVYLYLFLNDAQTSLQKTVALLMIGVGVIGELATAGFGMQVEGWAKTNQVLTESDFTFMILAVRILMFAHAAALIAYSSGDKIRYAFQDDDKDGIPNFADRVDNRKQRPMVMNASEEEPLPNSQGGGKKDLPR